MSDMQPMASNEKEEADKQLDENCCNVVLIYKCSIHYCELPKDHTGPHKSGELTY